MSNPTDKITVKGARQHNLKDINVEIPRDKLVVITGLSGSGKSSLAFDTIYAEGQRRYVESLSSYARQFLGLMEKPDMDGIEGLSPAISIEQKPQPEIQDPLLVLLRKSMIIFDSFMPILDYPIVGSVENRSKNKQFSKSLTQ